MIIFVTPLHYADQKYDPNCSQKYEASWAYL